MSRLPQVTPDLEFEFRNDPYIIDAYNICLKHEEKFATSDNEVRRIRILGLLLFYAPKQEIRVYVAKSILSCQDDSEALVKIDRCFELHVILPFKKYREGRTPVASTHSSRSSIESRWKDVKANIAQVPPRNHQDAKDRALIRDNWKCIVTGSIHRHAPREILDSPATKIRTYLECAHIVPEGSFFNVKEKEKPGGDHKAQLDYAATILTVLEPFGCDISDCNGEKVHSLVNVITMQKDIRDLFCRLELYFEATPTENCYEIKYYDGKPFPDMADFVTFSTPPSDESPGYLPVPSSELLALHATCCKVARMSGAAEYIDRVYDDVDGLGVLDWDGSSGDLLRYKLLSLSSSEVGDHGQ
ncbi:hypothetical protein NP233_g1407 [Leucocoprinus birnbaumii]|uniref:HNH nuclease domain-containing protein n=1 Tax=Leucocoprinus birnbaumii TaxID=56174 RepID=A0AAD5W5M6_9AGAR|nr:hypothetical protein NP233_g1407 [Leucocoprinus birnbaumii]